MLTSLPSRLWTPKQRHHVNHLQSQEIFAQRKTSLYPCPHPASDILEPAFFDQDLWPWTHLKFLLWQLPRQDLVGHLQSFIYSLTLQAEWLVFPLWVEKGDQGSPWGSRGHRASPQFVSGCDRSLLWTHSLWFSWCSLWEMVNVKLNNYNWIVYNQMTICLIFF